MPRTYQVVSERVRAVEELRQRRGKTPPSANRGVIIQRNGNRSSETGLDLVYSRSWIQRLVAACEEVGSLILPYDPDPRDMGKTGTTAPSAKPPDSAIPRPGARADSGAPGPRFAPTLTPRRPEIVDLRQSCGP